MKKIKAREEAEIYVKELIESFLLEKKSDGRSYKTIESFSVIVFSSSSSSGKPILADSPTLQYGSSKTPKGCAKKLHLFTYTNAVDLGDTAWAYNNDKKGVSHHGPTA